MLILRVLCVAMLVGIGVFTVAAVQQQGLDLVTPFLGDLIAMNWSGQFNFDFACYLTLSTVWFLWRNECSATSLAAAPFVLTGGILVLGVYLLYLTFKVDGRIDLLLLGPGRVSA